MQKVFVMNFKDEKQADEFIDRVFSNRDDGITVEIYSTPLEAFSHQEGPFRVNELIEDGYLEKLDDKNLLEKMGKETTEKINDNLHGEDDDYGPALDGDTLSQMATDSAVEVFREHLEELNEHDRKIAEKYIEDWE